MDEDKKKKVKIACVAGCMVIALVIFMLSRGKSLSSGRTKGTMQMLCVNEECNAEYEATAEQFRETRVPSGPIGTGGRGLGPQTFVCLECGEESAFVATKCVQCGFVFTQSYDDTDDYPDRCPECDHSAIEDRSSGN